ncbi:MAG: Tll0287-like domain-containing protein [Bacteroidota bacterium]
MTKYFVYFLVLASLLVSCGENGSVEEHAKVEKSTEHQRAIQLIENKCSACHNPDIPASSMMAPTFASIKQEYKSATADEAEFIKRFTAFVENPTREKALLKEAVDKYGLMAREGTKRNDLKKIAQYIYATDLPGTAKEAKGSSEDTPRGLSMALSTKKALGKNLMKAIEKGGAAHAVEFCNTRALPITDSMSAYHEARIRRVSDRPRNPSNRASDEVLQVIEQYKNALISNEKPQPVVQEKGDSIQFYAPIVTNNMCLKCHGQPEKEINLSTLEKIDSLYPSDEATGYEENEVRGVWNIIYKK